MADLWSLYNAWECPHKTFKVFKKAVSVCIVSPMPASGKCFIMETWKNPNWVSLIMTVSPSCDDHR